MESPDLGPRHTHYALNLAAQHLGQPSLTPDQYARARDELVARDQRRHDGGCGLAAMMPTVGQVERIALEHWGEEDRKAGPWDWALQYCDLEPRVRTRRPRREGLRSPSLDLGLPAHLAIHHFIEHNEFEWPSRERVREFSRLADFRLAADGGTSAAWAEQKRLAREHRTTLGLPSPISGPARTGRGAKKTINYPADGIPGAPPRKGSSPAPSHRPRQEVAEWPREHCLNVLDQFDRDIPSYLAPTQKRYLQLYYDRDNWPPPSYFAVFGGFRALMQQMRERRRER